MKQMQCSCGSKNPYGTEICSACGNILKKNAEKVDMRYEGSARRSQVYNKNPIDKTWNFFFICKSGGQFYYYCTNCIHYWNNIAPRANYSDRTSTRRVL